MSSSRILAAVTLAIGLLLAAPRTQAAARRAAPAPPALAASELAQIRRALPHWLAVSPTKALEDYRLATPEARRSARIGTPVLAYHPDLSEGDIAIDALVSRLCSGPTLWYAPVLVGTAPACLLQASTGGKDSVRVDAIGFVFLARRIAAANEYVRTHGLGRVEAVVRLRHPLMDLALARDRSRTAVWLQLLGTETASAAPIPPDELRRGLLTAAANPLPPGQLR